MKEILEHALLWNHIVTNYKLVTKIFNLIRSLIIIIIKQIFLISVLKTLSQVVLPDLMLLFWHMDKLVVVRHIQWGHHLHWEYLKIRQELFQEYLSLFFKSKKEESSLANFLNLQLNAHFLNCTMKNFTIYLILQQQV